MLERLQRALRGPRPFALAAATFAYNHVIGRLPGYGLRRAWLRGVLRHEVDAQASVHMGCFVTGRRISLGARAVINRGCVLDGRGGLEIGADASISPQCCLLSLTHDPQDPDFAAVARPVRVGARAWIGTRALVLPGVRIGEGAVVGAGAVVTRDVPDFAIVAGNPARVIGARGRDLRYTLDYRPWLDTDVLPP